MPATPVTPVAAPATPNEVEPQAKKRAKRVPKAQEPLTPLQKGRDVGQQVMKKKNETSTLALNLASIPYTEQIRADMEKFAAKYEHSG